MVLADEVFKIMYKTVHVNQKNGEAVDEKDVINDSYKRGGGGCGRNLKQDLETESFVRRRYLK